MVYDALKEVEGLKPKRPHWEIAQELRIVPKTMWIDKTDTIGVAAGKKNVLTAIVGRYKKRVTEVIQLTALGKFASQDKPNPIRKPKDEAIPSVVAL